MSKLKVFLVLVLGVAIGIVGQSLIINADSVLPSVKINVDDVANKISQSNGISRFDEIYQILNNEFFYTGKLQSGAMMTNALKGFVDALDDPYTVYMSTDENKGFQDTLKGEQDFEGIGAVVRKKENGILIEEVLKGSPAQKAGLKPLDVILQVSGTKVDTLSVNDAVKLIRGPKGTEVELTILRDNGKEDKKIFNQKVIRDTLVLPSVTSKLLSGTNKKTIGYIAISIIGEETENILKSEITEMKKSNPQGIILDLRGNGGGFLPIAVEVSSHFIAKDKIIVSSKYKTYADEVFRSKGYGDFEGLPVVVLVDGYTASAGEIIALALRETIGAVLVGVKTFGKGSIQTIYEISDGSSIKYTIGKRYSPNGSNIDHIGAKPDVEIEFDNDEYQKTQKDNQLEKAKEELSKIIK